MRRWLNLHKPTATRSAQLALAEGLWTVVGGGLSLVGLYWIVARYGTPGIGYAVPLLLIGVLKALLILDRVARRAVERIQARGRDDCAGGFFSATSWMLILAMMALGQVLRASSLSSSDVGFIYVAVGSALLISSRIFWQTWLRYRRATP